MQNWRGLFLGVESIFEAASRSVCDCEVTSLFQVATYFDIRIKLHTITSENS